MASTREGSPAPLPRVDSSRSIDRRTARRASKDSVSAWILKRSTIASSSRGARALDPDARPFDVVSGSGTIRMRVLFMAVFHCDPRAPGRHARKRLRERKFGERERGERGKRSESRHFR